MAVAAVFPPKARSGWHLIYRYMFFVLKPPELEPVSGQSLSRKWGKLALSMFTLQDIHPKMSGNTPVTPYKECGMSTYWPQIRDDLVHWWVWRNIGLFLNYVENHK